MKNCISYVYPPVIDTFSGVAGNVANLMTKENSWLLFVRNYFLTTYNHTIHAPGFNWLYFDDSFKMEISINDELENVGIIETVEKYIDEGYLVNLYLDHFYLPQTDVYGVVHKSHDVSNIFGYDSEKKIFVVGDNFYKGKYEIKEVLYEDVVMAREKIPEAPAFREMNVIENYTVDKDTVMTILRSYRDSTCYFSKDCYNERHLDIIEQDVEYGIAVYDVLVNQIKDGPVDGKYDIRPFHIMINHMNIYHYLLDAYCNDDALTSKADELIEDATIIRNMYIKHSFTGKNKDKLIKAVIALREKEISLLDKVIIIL